MNITNIIKRGLIVSCQALQSEPLHSSYIMSRMAAAAYEGGAVAIRSNSGVDIKAIKQEVALPIIGLVKKEYNDSEIYITPTMVEVDEVVKAGAEVVAIDATDRVRPNNESLSSLVSNIKAKYPNIYLMADIATLEEAIEAEKVGFDIVSSTLCGYTPNTKNESLPNLDLVQDMVKKLSIPVIAEGGIWNPSEASRALEVGAYAVVVGTAITRPREITKRFVSEMREIL